MAHIEDVDQQNCGYSPINLGDDPQSLKRHDRRKNRVRLSFLDQWAIKTRQNMMA
jgi:hypothetical protein